MQQLLPTQELILKGIQRLQAIHKESEQGKLGILRAGNTGALLANGKAVGKCMRLSLLRALGVDGDVENTSREFMFAAGRTNEDSWLEKLAASGIPLSRIKRETDWPISWQLTSGRMVTGRPDFVLLDAEGKPERGLELKLVSSIWTGRDVLIKGRPKMEHLLQATHYAWKVGCTFEIWYTNRALFQIPYMGNVKWPARGSALSKYFDYDDDTDEVRSMTPFSVGFEVRVPTVETEPVEFAPITEGPRVWVKSPISVAGIRNWYETLDKHIPETYTKLPPRPDSLLADGDRKSSKVCSYCPLSQVCDKREGRTKQEWIKEAQNWLGTLPMGGSMPTTKDKIQE